MTASIAIKVSQLSVNYGSTAVLWDLNFEIPAGTLVAIVGPNGAGKSTFLKAALGLIRPVAGFIRFFDQPYKQVVQRIAYVPQRESVDWEFPITVEDVVLMGRYGRLGLFRWPGRKDRLAALAVLKQVGMEAYAQRQISQLSGGQQQRVFIARALLQDADIYFMDEPFSGVDVATEQVILELMQRLRDQGKTVFVVHHDLHTVERVYDWVILLNLRLVACGPVQEVFTLEMIERAFGKQNFLFAEALKLSRSKTSGLE